MRLPPPRTRRGCLFCLCAAAPLGGGRGVLEGACGEGWQLEAVAREYEAVAARPRGADAPAAAPSARGRGLRERQGAPISVEVFFLATCPHCYHFVHNSLLPFLDAGLPGDGVVVTLLPLLKGMSSSDSCRITDACSLSLAPLCALKEALPMPAPADSEALRRGAGFVECDLGLTAMVSLGRDEDATKTCSKQAGIPWSGEDGLQACFEGREAFDIMYSTDYADSVVAAMHRLTDAKFTEPPSMPWVFIDGQLFTCEESGSCSSAPGFQKSGERGQGSGTLLELVCGMIGDGRGQEQCAKVKKPPKSHAAEEGAHPQPAQIAQCESCFAVGGPRWGLLRGQGGAVLAALALAAAARGRAAAAGRALRLARRRPPAASGPTPPGAAAAAREGATLLAESQPSQAEGRREGP